MRLIILAAALGTALHGFSSDRFATSGSRGLAVSHADLATIRGGEQFPCSQTWQKPQGGPKGSGLF